MVQVSNGKLQGSMWWHNTVHCHQHCRHPMVERWFKSLLYFRSSSLLVCLRKQQKMARVLGPQSQSTLQEIPQRSSGVLDSALPCPGPQGHLETVLVDGRFSLYLSLILCNSVFQINKSLKIYRYFQGFSHILLSLVLESDGL